MARTLRHKKGIVTNMVGAELFSRKEQNLPNYVYEFDGATMYATIPRWTPNGLPFSVSVNGVVLTVGGNTYLNGDNEYGLRITGESVPRTALYYTDPAGSNTNLIVNDTSVAGVATDNLASFTGAGAEFTVNGTMVSNGTPSGITRGVDIIGAYNTAGTNSFHGPIWNVALTDNSPLQNRSVCYGDGARYVQLDAPLTLDGEYDVEFALIRQDNGVADYWAILAGESNTSQLGIIIWNTAAASNPNKISIYTDAGAATTIGDVFDDVALGQHCKVRVVREADNTHSVYVDGVLKTTTAALGGSLYVDTFASRAIHPNSLKMPANSALGDIIIRDLTNNREWNYQLDPAGLDTDIGNSKFVIAPGDLGGQVYGWNGVTGNLVPTVYGLSGANVVEMKAESGDIFTLELDAMPEFVPPTLVFGKIDWPMQNAGGNVWTATVPGVHKRFADAQALGETVTIEFEEKGLTWTILDAPNTHRSTQGNYLNQPLYNRSTLDGNGARYITIPKFQSASGAEALRWKMSGIRADTPAGNSSVRWLNGSGTGSYLLLNDSGHANPNDVFVAIGGGRTWTGALASVAQGEHFELEVVSTDGANVDLLINGVSQGAQTLPSAAWDIDSLYGYSTSALPDGAAMGNVILENLTTGEAVGYKVDEGEGDIVYAYEVVNGEISDIKKADGPETLLNGDFSQGETGWNFPGVGNGSWSVVNGQAVSVGSTSNDFLIAEGSALEVGKIYRYEFDILHKSGASSYVSIGGNGSEGRINNPPLGRNVGYAVALSTESLRINCPNLNELTIDNITVVEVQHGIITPDADWTLQPEYSNDGEWTPDTDWQFIEDNSRFYPMNEGSGSTIKNVLDDSGATDGTIVNADDGNWIIE